MNEFFDDISHIATPITTPDQRTVSYSQYSMWKNCPLQWKLIYVDRLVKQEDSIHTVFGKAIHNAIQWWLPQHFEDARKALRVNIDPVFKEHLIKEFTKSIIVNPDGSNKYICDQNDLQEFYDDGCGILTHLMKHAKKYFPTKGFELVGVEYKLIVGLREKLKFVGYIDIIIHDTKLNEYHIIDLKTSTRGWHEMQKKDKGKTNQILLYKKFYSEIFNVDHARIHPLFIILKRKINEDVDWPVSRLGKVEPSHGVVSMRRMEKSWNAFLDECFTPSGDVVTDQIKATPSEQACRFCPFKDNVVLCPDNFNAKVKRSQELNRKLAKIE